MKSLKNLLLVNYCLSCCLWLVNKKVCLESVALNQTQKEIMGNSNAKIVEENSSQINRLKLSLYTLEFKLNNCTKTLEKLDAGIKTDTPRRGKNCYKRRTLHYAAAPYDYSPFSMTSTQRPQSSINQQITNV